MTFPSLSFQVVLDTQIHSVISGCFLRASFVFSDFSNPTIMVLHDGYSHTNVQDDSVFLTSADQLTPVYLIRLLFNLINF